MKAPMAGSEPVGAVKATPIQALLVVGVFLFAIWAKVLNWLYGKGCVIEVPAITVACRALTLQTANNKACLYNSSPGKVS